MPRIPTKKPKATIARSGPNPPARAKTNKDIGKYNHDIAVENKNHDRIRKDLKRIGKDKTVVRNSRG